MIIINLIQETTIALQKRVKNRKNNTKEEISKNQKEFFLREQIKAIKSELGDGGEEPEDEIAEFKTKVEKANMPEEVEKETDDSTKSSSASIVRNILLVGVLVAVIAFIQMNRRSGDNH